tara:strand:- start:778 stop:1140 length:363 start_codon:yes stop_codon:yes gene_type:complete
MDIRKQKVINLIRSQTNYNETEALEKLTHWNNDYLKVIKEYLNPDFEKKKEIKKQSTNQRVMKEIRSFMDNSSQKYINKKNNIETNEDKLKKEIYTNLANINYIDNNSKNSNETNIDDNK